MLVSALGRFEFISPPPWDECLDCSAVVKWVAVTAGQGVLSYARQHPSYRPTYHWCIYIISAESESTLLTANGIIGGARVWVRLCQEYSHCRTGTWICRVAGCPTGKSGRPFILANQRLRMWLFACPPGYIRVIYILGWWGGTCR